MKANIKPRTILVHGQPVILTVETIAATRRSFADNCKACIEEAQSGKVRVNDLPSYIVQKRHEAAGSLVGKNDNCLSFLQKAVYIQTDECVPLMA